ncbi:MAG TPA: NHL repeat-containing protein [Solirubrobacteraceae bacterium]|nr:NHL repeat-containing protein [Solirubrobacteraceae bacterium]
MNARPQRTPTSHTCTQRAIDTKASRHARTIALCLALSALTAILLTPAPASAKFTRPFIRQLSVPNRPRGVAVDSANNVYVLNQYPGSAVIDKFDSAGNPLAVLTGEGHLQPESIERSSTLAIANASGDLYVGGKPVQGSAGGSVDVFEPNGTFLSELGGFEENIFGVAVDNSSEAGDHIAGDLLVTEERGGILLFSPSGTPVNFIHSASYINGNEITGTPGGKFGYQAPWAVATDEHGDIYVTNPSSDALDEFDSTGAFVREIAGGGGHSVAVDPTNGHIIVDGGEFDSSGNSLGGVSLPSGTQSSGVAVDSLGDLYVGGHRESGGVEENMVDEFGPGAFLPDVAVSGASERTPASATVKGEVNPEDLALTDCHFEYVTDAAFEATGFSDLSSGGEAPCVPDPASIPVDSNFHLVQAALTGLASGVTYHFRLVAASDPSSLGGTADSAPASFVTPGEPTVDSTSASNVASSFADLHAEIDPHGADTTYQFEYITATGYEAAVAEHAANPYSAGGVIPITPADIGPGGTDASVVQQVGGLIPETEYHFRVLAKNGLGSVPGVDETFITLPAGLVGLPDGRTYELVTPANKGDGEDMFGVSGEKNFDVGVSSESGDQFLLDTTSSFGPFPASGENTYVFSRGATGWTYKSLAAPNLGVQSLATEAFDQTDFSQVGIHDFTGSHGETTAELVGPPGGPYTTVETGQANTPSDASIEGHSSDMSHVVLETSDHALTSGDASQDPESSALYDASNGGLSLVNVNTDGTLTSRCGAVLGGAGGRGPGGGSHNAVSSDGSKIFFTSPDPYGSGFHCRAEGYAPQLYMRENGERTVEISAPQSGVKDPSGIQPAMFIGASNDGSRVFFVTTSELTKNDEGIHDSELYEYDTVTSTLTRVSSGVSGNAAGDVEFVPAISGDGSTVYFASGSQLAPGAVSGALNLYHYDTDTETTTYVATVNKADYPFSAISRWYSGPGGGEVGSDDSANWYTTSDGNYLVFASTASLTSYSTSPGTGATCPEITGGGDFNVACTEVYRYAFPSRTITCVSCNPSGVAPVSNAEFAFSADRANKPAGMPPRPVSENGSYVFFDTADGLVPRDTNGQRDVYEWHEGVISLISSGTDAQDSVFLDSSADGSNVFFGTHAKLVPQDTDGSGDLYDARIDGGFGSFTGAGACEGDACDNPPLPPIDQTPASLTFSGLGNPSSAPSSAVTTKPKAKKKTKPKHKPKHKKAKKAKRAVAKHSRARGARDAHINGRAGK